MKRIRFIAIVMLCAACAGNHNPSSMSFTIDGQFSNAASKTLYLEEVTPDNGAQFVDSIVCDKKGHFKYKGTMDYQTFFVLHSSESDNIVLLPDDGENIKLTGDCTDLGHTYLVSDSKGSQQLWQIKNYINETDNAIGEIVRMDRENKATLNEADYEAAHKVTDSLFVAQHTATYLMMYNFIEDNAGSLSTLYAIDAPFNLKGRVFYAEPDFEVFETVLEGLETTLPNNPHTQYYRIRVDRERSARILRQQQQQPGQEIIIE